MGNYFSKKSNYDIKNAETNNFTNSDQIIRSNNSIDKCGVTKDSIPDVVEQVEDKSSDEDTKEEHLTDCNDLEVEKVNENDSYKEISKQLPVDDIDRSTPIKGMNHEPEKIEIEEQHSKSSLIKEDLTNETDHEFTFEDSEYLNHDSDMQQETIDHISTAVHCSDFDDTQALMSEPTINLNFSENEELPKSDLDEIYDFVDPRSPSVDIIRTPLMPIGNMENVDEKDFVMQLDSKNIVGVKKDGTPKKMKNKCDDLRKKVFRNKRKIQEIYDDSENEQSNDENLPPCENLQTENKGELSLLADQFGTMGINSPTAQKN